MPDKLFFIHWTDLPLLYNETKSEARKMVNHMSKSGYVQIIVDDYFYDETDFRKVYCTDVFAANENSEYLSKKFGRWTNPSVYPIETSKIIFVDTTKKTSLIPDLCQI